MYLHFFNYILNYIHNSYIKKTQELKILESFYSKLFLASSLSLQSGILRKSSLNQCAIFRFADLYNIIFTCCFCSSFNSSNRFNNSFLECLKYFLSLFGNFFCSSFRTLSNAHIICLIQWYLSTTCVAFLSQVSDTLKYVFHISLANNSTSILFSLGTP